MLRRAPQCVRTAGPCKGSRALGLGPVYEDGSPAYVRSEPPRAVVVNRVQSLALNKRLVAMTGSEEILKLVKLQSAKFSDVNLATALYRLGKLQKKSADGKAVNMYDARLEKLTAIVAKRIYDGDGVWAPRELANVSWGISHLEKIPSKKYVYEGVAGLAADKANDFNSHDITNTVLAFSKAKMFAPRMFSELSKAALVKITTFRSQELANVVLAYSKINFPAPALFDAVAVAVPQKLEFFATFELANLAWAFARSGGGGGGGGKFPKTPEIFAAVHGRVMLPVR
ncbi:hypothetical protein M885DRAFT_498640 [Pelagophyceae sp. CCMP2097]|nr:hypothetical protein M885DRAFT_498640 [Pelagophyceae sp. CCMP2097]